MTRLERLVVPAPKSSFSTRRVRLPPRAHSCAMATPLMPPPTTTTSKWRLSSVGLCVQLLTFIWMLVCVGAHVLVRTLLARVLHVDLRRQAGEDGVTLLYVRERLHPAGGQLVFGFVMRVDRQQLS